MRALLRVLLGFSVMLPSVLLQQKPDDVCIDLNTNQNYSVGQVWFAEGKCLKYKCDKMTVEAVPGLTIPATTKYVCAEPTPSDKDLRNCYQKVPYPTAPYPKCCPHLICNRPGRVEIIRPKYD